MFAFVRGILFCWNLVWMWEKEEETERHEMSKWVEFDKIDDGKKCFHFPGLTNFKYHLRNITRMQCPSNRFFSRYDSSLRNFKPAGTFNCNSILFFSRSSKSKARWTHKIFQRSFQNFRYFLLLAWTDSTFKHFHFERRREIAYFPS